MKINYKNNTIEMTKKEAKAAAIYDSEECKALLKIKEDFPGFIVAVREIKSSTKRKSSSKGFSYEKMELYINSYGSDEQKQQFASLRQASKDTMGGSCKAYKHVKEWFVATFPEAGDFASAVARITAKSAA